jgi:hypothetical protein
MSDWDHRFVFSEKGICVAFGFLACFLILFLCFSLCDLYLYYFFFLLVLFLNFFDCPTRFDKHFNGTS